MMTLRAWTAFIRHGFLVFSLALPLGSSQASDVSPGAARLELSSSERLITILQTNDIHGAIEPSLYRSAWGGGMAMWAGVVTAIRQGLAAQFGSRAGTLLLDGGDQFQGTLISNYNEGRLVFDLMNLAGYDAVVPGNHDYDFGPEGWLVDRVTPEHPDQNPRGVIEELSRRARFPLLSANTYLRESLVDSRGNGVIPEESPDQVDWTRARRPGFLQPYRLLEVAGVRVALIGLDHWRTPLMTTGENVSDLYFRNEADTYDEIRRELDGRADVFVLVTHNGNASAEFAASDLVTEIFERARRGAESASPSGWLHAVVAGHTHFVNNVRVEGVPIVQSGANGDRFGRIDLVWDSSRKVLNAEKTRTFAGLRILPDGCVEEAGAFCEVLKGNSIDESRPAYEGVPADPDLNALRMIADERKKLEPIAERVLGVADGELWRNRTIESPLANAMTDALRSLSGAEVAFMNTGGLRAPIDAGPVSYEDLFRVLPFSNRAVTLEPVKFERILSLIERSIKSCGNYGALMASGIRVLFEQDCQNRARNGVDPEAVLFRVTTPNGEVIYDRRARIRPDDDRRFVVATLDFLAEGGSGYGGFAGVPVHKDHGVLREAMTERFLREPMSFKSERDRRWMAVRPAADVLRIVPRAVDLMGHLFSFGH